MTNRLNDKNVDMLLDKLSSDDDFRQRFQANPREAMASIGLADASDESISNAPIGNLPSKSDIASSRDQLRAKLMVAMDPFVPITLDMHKR